MPSLSIRSPRFFQVSSLSLRHLALAGLLALFGLSQGFAQATAAPQSHPVASAPAASQEQETAPPKDDASHQGIKVHGHWKIVVKNADGSVAHAHEFENSLATYGGTVLTNYLTGNATPGQMAISVTSSGTSICATVNCVLVPSATVGIGVSLCSSALSGSNTCTAGLTTTSAGNGQLTVSSGQLTATRAGTITAVGSIVGSCNTSVTPTACQALTVQLNNGFTYFTSTTVNPIAVNAGQIVQVSVTISFS